MRLDSELLKRTGSKSLSEQVYLFLRQQIVTGLIFQRERLIEGELSQQLGVSRTPVREAIKRLQADGLVIVTLNKGAQTASISIKEIEESYQIVGGLEGFAAALATKKINKRDIKQLNEVNEQLSQHVYQNSSPFFLEKDKEFHSVYLNKCGNTRLLRVIKSELESIHRYRIISHSIPKRLTRSLKQHKKIIEGFRAGNPDVSRRAVEEHILYGGRLLVDYIKENEIILG
jgi:DNA-binding GntR family transcriptional regulator